MRTRTTVAGALLIFCLALLAVRLPVAIAQRSMDYAQWDPLIEVQTLVDRFYFEEPDYEAMQEGAIRGMLEALDDPYTVYIPAQEVDDFDRTIRGSYVGIGAEVNSADGFLKIVSPMDDSPAYKSGVEADDLVVAVDGESTYELRLDEI
ncbi:MAG: hypothetical protein AAFX05_06525, partial [Planctomycetota bacterium]